MRNIIVFSILLLISLDVFACLNAGQDRIFPIGVTFDGNLVVMEVEIGRTEKRFSKEEREKFEKNTPFEFIPIYSLTSKLKLYNKKHNTLETLILNKRTKVESDNLEPFLKVSFLEAQRLATTCYELNPICVEKQEYIYSEKDTCKKTSFSFDNKSRKTFLKDNNSFHLINVLKKSEIGYNHFIKYSSYDAPYFDVLKTELNILYITTYSTGNYNFSIAHIGSGDVRHLKEEKITKQFDDITSSIDIFPIIHHGETFDFILF